MSKEIIHKEKQHFFKSVLLILKLILRCCSNLCPEPLCTYIQKYVDDHRHGDGSCRSDIDGSISEYKSHLAEQDGTETDPQIKEGEECRVGHAAPVTGSILDRPCLECRLDTAESESI